MKLYNNLCSINRVLRILLVGLYLTVFMAWQCGDDEPKPCVSGESVDVTIEIDWEAIERYPFRGGWCPGAPGLESWSPKYLDANKKGQNDTQRGTVIVRISGKVCVQEQYLFQTAGDRSIFKYAPKDDVTITVEYVEACNSCDNSTQSHNVHYRSFTVIPAAQMNQGATIKISTLRYTHTGNPCN